MLTLQGEALTQAVSLTLVSLQPDAELLSPNVGLSPPGHKPEGCKEQPGSALPVQRRQAVEAAAGKRQVYGGPPLLL